MGAFRDELYKQRWDTVLSLKRKTKLAREDFGLEVAENKKTSVLGRIISMIDIKDTKYW
jgi:hypothetical protein